jgi:hypothetical protein
MLASATVERRDSRLACERRTERRRAEDRGATLAKVEMLEKTGVRVIGVPLFGGIRLHRRNAAQVFQIPTEADE